MDENETLQNLRLALEEANRWLRYLDNFFWIISSFWMVGTGFAVSKAIEWEGKNWQILIVGIIMIVAWILYLFFLQNVLRKSQEFYDRVNYFENELRIDVIPQNQIKGGIAFRTIMIIVACSSIVIMCGFIVQFVI